MSVVKVVSAFLPSVIFFAVGVDGVANNPVTVTDVGLMVAGIGLAWFGGIMLKTRDIVIALEGRVSTLEAKDRAEIAAAAAAAATSAAVAVIMEAKKERDL